MNKRDDENVFKIMAAVLVVLFCFIMLFDICVRSYIAFIGLTSSDFVKGSIIESFNGPDDKSTEDKSPSEGTGTYATPMPYYWGMDCGNMENMPVYDTGNIPEAVFIISQDSSS